MFASGLSRALLTLMLLLVVAGCSKHAEIENVLENYYRAAAKGDAASMENMGDHRMFTLTTSSERGLLRSKIYQRMDEMDKLSNANGELKKIKIIKVEDASKDNSGEFLLVEFNLIFKNDRTILKKEIISHQDGKAKLYIVNEWK